MSAYKDTLDIANERFAECDNDLRLMFDEINWLKARIAQLQLEITRKQVVIDHLTARVAV